MLQSCGFEESLGSSVSEFTVSMVTKGFPQCLLCCAETTQSQVCVVSVYAFSKSTWTQRGNIPMLTHGSFLDHFPPFLLKLSQLGFGPSSGGPVPTSCCWSDTLDVVQRLERPQGWISPIAGQTEGCFL